MFIPLHVHTDKGSVGDSVLHIKDYVLKGKELGLTHLAITDHGSMSGMIEFYDLCKDNDIIPIIGMEAYVVNGCIDNTIQDKDVGANSSHLILLAKNADGVKNILRIHNNATLNGYYYKPRADLRHLRQYGNGIIATSACVGGEIPGYILSNNPNKAIELINIYKEIFDEFYLEIQPGTFDRQIIVNKGIVQLSRYTNTPIVVTTDTHYLNQEDYLAHNYHVQSIRHADVNTMAYPDKCYYFMSEEELKESFNQTKDDKYITDEIIQEAIDNTVKIANQCDGQIDWQFEMPKFIGLPEGETDDSYIAKLCHDALNRRIKDLKDPVKYEDRLEYELDTIKSLGFSGYFLIIQDLLNYARSKNIAVGPGRGSCGGSIVSWLLNITIADPIKYNLLFERFLSKERTGFPDIDVDISADRRHELQLYTLEKYGKDCCALVMTYTMRKAKTAIKDAARLLNIDLDVANTIAKLIPMKVYGDDGESMTDLSITESLNVVPELKQYQQEYPELFNMALKMEGLPSSCNGVHAAGIVISPTSLLSKVPLKWHYDKVNDITLPVACLTKENIERIAIKFDYLALGTVALINKTQKDVGAVINLTDDDFYNDEKVWETIGSKFTDGMFQISSNTYKQRMPRLKPKNIQELAACLALVRSPCIMAHTDEDYMQIVENKKPPEYISQEHYNVTKDTNGICIYQEEVMALAVEYGFDMETGYKILKAVSKKKLDKIKAYEKEFKDKVAARGQNKSIQDKLFKILLDAGLYSFNKSHALCYSIVTYISAWLKYYYPSYFMANLLTSIYNNGKDKLISSVLKDCQNKNIKFLPLDINKSDWDFKIEDNNIRLGFCAIKSFGIKAARNIEEIRKSGGIFKSFTDFLERVDGRLVNKTSIITGIFTGCFDNLVFNSDENKVLGLKELYEQYCLLRKFKDNGIKNNIISPIKSISFNIKDTRDSINKILLGGKYKFDSK